MPRKMPDGAHEHAEEMLRWLDSTDIQSVRLAAAMTFLRAFAGRRWKGPGPDVQNGPSLERGGGPGLGKWGPDVPFSAAAESTTDVTSAGIRNGDLIVLSSLRQWTSLRSAPAVVKQVPRNVFGDLRECFPLREIVGVYASARGADRIRRYIAMGSRGHDSTSRLFTLRWRRTRVSQPIAANSDQGALFELLSQVGGLMPVDGGANT